MSLKRNQRSRRRRHTDYCASHAGVPFGPDGIPSGSMKLPEAATILI